MTPDNLLETRTSEGGAGIPTKAVGESLPSASPDSSFQVHEHFISFALHGLHDIGEGSYHAYFIMNEG